MRIEVRNRCSDFDSYRAARVKSLFNCESGQNFELAADLAVDDGAWKIGVVVGPSGSGKTSIGRLLFGGGAIYEPAGWRDDAPIVDCIMAGGDFDEVTAALSAVGLGSVPAWLRPYRVLSNGERFRADLAKIVAERPERVVIDEFTSVVDRQIAKFGALAFQKAWRRGDGKAVLLSCHYDIIEWLEPDWVFDTGSGKFERGSLWRRPRFDLEIRQVDGSWWPYFEPHHYLKLPRMVAAEYFIGLVDGEPVCHVAVAPRLEMAGVRACRLVVMPEWQGAGVGMRFLNAVCEMQITGAGRYGARVLRAYFHTSHPGLCAALRRDRRWAQVSAVLAGAHKGRSHASIKRCQERRGAMHSPNSGFGGHFRAVQGFKMERRATPPAGAA